MAFSCKRCGICPSRGTRRMVEAATGAVTLIQRFGSATNLKIHLHTLVLDDVYGNLDAADTAGSTDERSPATAAPTFHLAGQGHDLDAQYQRC